MRFWKMQGVGNDFVTLDAATLPGDTDWAGVAVRLCERRFAVGADGLLVVSRRASVGEAPPAPNSGGARTLVDTSGVGNESPAPPELGAGGASEGAAFAMRMFNPDGSEDMCGNGLRCVGLWASRAGWVGAASEFMVATKEGPRRCRLVEVSADGQSGLLDVGMGTPRFAPQEIPICAPGGGRVQDFPLAVGDRTFAVTCVNTGSTHTVIFGDAPDEDTFQHYSPLIETHPLFPERTSVLWATPDGPNRFVTRIWERGAGETLGCGTGACAVGVAARRHGFVTGNAPIAVVSKGGTLHIDWPGGDAEIGMLGPAQFVFEGEIALAAS